MSGESNVLHVDDDPGFRDLTVAKLEARGFAVEVATDAESGLDRLASGSFDCVVSDYEMPGLDGLAFLERVRERWDLPFVLFTGAGDESVASRALAAGATGYVRKHDDGAFDELADRVRRSVASWRATRDLRKRARHYRLVAEHLPNAVVFLFDREFRYRFAAGEGLVGLGLSPDDVEGRTLADVAATPEQYEFIAERYRRVLDGEEVRIEHRVNGREFETRLVPVAGARTSDGTRDGPGPPDDSTGAGSSEDPTAAGPSDDATDVDARDDATDVGTPIEVDAAVDVDDRTRRTSDDGAGRTTSTSGATKIQYGLGIGTDVTAQRRRERALEQQTERLGRFASVASHDLRNPLSAARGWLEMGQSAIDDGDDPTAALESAERALERTERILDDVRALAEGAAPVDAERVEPVGLADVATEVWTDVGDDAAGLQVETDAVVRGDPVRVRRLVENLFRNAVEHGTRTGDDGDPDGNGEDAVTVTLGELPDGGFYVGDDGPGIPDADRETVFEHGYTTRVGGTGHGLAIVTEIAATHGWSVVATEGTDGGARIEVRDVEFVARDGRE
jgi:PAS domain S-box-containing protein